MHTLPLTKINGAFWPRHKPKVFSAASPGRKKGLAVRTIPVTTTQYPQALQFHPSNKGCLFVYWNLFIEKCFGGVRWRVKWNAGVVMTLGDIGRKGRGIEDTIIRSVLLHHTSISVTLHKKLKMIHPKMERSRKDGQRLCLREG